MLRVFFASRCGNDAPALIRAATMAQKNDTSHLCGDMEDLIEKIDRINLKILDSLYYAFESLVLFKLIGLNIRSVKEKTDFYHWLSFVERMALDSFIVNICKVFDSQKIHSFEQNSINNMLSIIHLNNLQPRDTATMQEFLRKYSSASKIDNANVARLFIEVCKHYLKEHQGEWTKLKKARDKRTVHSEYGVEIKNTASFHALEAFLKFGIDFYQTISQAYVCVFPVQFEDHLTAASVALFSKLGIDTDDIKMEF